MPKEHRAKNQIETIAVYSRKSRYTGKGESVENQIGICRQRIAADYPQVREENIFIFEDEGFSGGNTNRPQFQQMMRDARERKFDAVICYRLDRISRNIGDFAGLIEEFNRLGVAFISIRDKFDTDSSMGRAMMYIASVFSQLERETIAERIRDNMHELAKTGRWLGGNPPTGYKSAEVVSRRDAEGRMRKAFRLEEIPDEARLVQQIFNKFLACESLTKVETDLLLNGVKTKRGHDFTRFAIKNILQNPVYLTADERAWDYFEKLGVEVYAARADFDGSRGVMAYNKTCQRPGRANEPREMQDWIIAVGLHQGLIDSSDWVKAQTLLSQNRLKAYRKPKSNVALLSGILFCAHCNSYMRPKLTRRKNARGEVLYSYLCETKEKSRMHRCQMKNPNGNELDLLVCEKIRELSESGPEFDDLLERAKQALWRGGEQEAGRAQQLKKELQERERQIDSLVKAMAQSGQTAAYGHIVRQINLLDDGNQRLREQIAQLEGLMGDHALSGIEFDLLRGMLSDFKSAFEAMAAEQKRAALRVFVRKIVWDGENAHLYLFGTEDGEIELPEKDFKDLQDAFEEPQRADSK